MLTTPVFNLFAQEWEEADEIKKQDDLADEIDRHWKMMRLCWSEWEGPVVDPNSINGYCQVHHITVYSITHKENRYHYMAPCRILSISKDLIWLEVEVEYEENSHCAHYNGERLKLHITDVWAPVYMINRRHPFTENAVKKVLDDNKQKIA